MNVVIFGIILSCFAAVGVWLIWSTARLIDRMPPYRRVLRRYPADDAEGGEIIELECGHGLRLHHIHREQFPCEECRDAHSANAEQPKLSGSTGKSANA
jgi:hypothetical protein